uniref:Ig-like domain-containing protein n=1 Tax=Sarcophilus harrisii TaxID=9305 RepID=A0A7N4PN58_SARHA
MSTRFLSLVIIFLLRTGLMNAGVTQIPRHLVKGKGQEMNLMCKQDLGHDAMFWYQQDVNREIRMMFYFSNQQLITNETASSRFQSGFHKEKFNLKIELLQLEDTGTYFCASSK